MNLLLIIWLVTPILYGPLYAYSAYHMGHRAGLLGTSAAKRAARQFIIFSAAGISYALLQLMAVGSAIISPGSILNQWSANLMLGTMPLFFLGHSAWLASEVWKSGR